MRKILHIDLDAFFCAVEELRNPALVGKPFAVGGKPEERGVVSSCSYPARRLGIRSALPMAMALRIYPQLLVVSPHHSAYGQFSRKVMHQLQQFTPLIEQISIDEAFLDITGLAENPAEVAQHIQEIIHQELGLPCSLGGATNKLVAKIATDVGKHASISSTPPNAITIVPPGKEAEFLAPLPVQALWGVGPNSSEKLNSLGIRTIGDLAGFQVTDLIRVFGKTGQEFSQHAKGIDERPIVTFHEPKSISQEITYSRDIADREQLRHTLKDLCDGVGKKVREEKRCGTTVQIKLRWPDFTTITRQVTLPAPTDQDKIIYQAALSLFEKNCPSGKYVRLIGVGIDGLCPPIYQLELWDNLDSSNSEKDRSLRITIEELRHRFGNQIVRRASDLESKGGSGS
jgi:DNA polymerase-4